MLLNILLLSFALLSALIIFISIAPRHYLWEIYGLFFDWTYALRVRQKLMSDILGQVAKIDGNLILDFGAGTGIIDEFLLQENAQLEFLVLEPTQAMRRKLKNRHMSHVTLLASDMEIDALNDASVDAIICVNVLYLIPEYAHIIEQFKKKLRTNGTLVLVLPKLGSSPSDYLTSEKLLLETQGYSFSVRCIMLAKAFAILLLPLLVTLVIKFREGVGHYHFFTEKEIQFLLSEKGFQVTSVTLTDGNCGYLVIATIL